MAVFPERIILKNSTDSSAYIIAAIAPGGSNACVPGEIVVQRLNGSVRLYALDSTNVPRQITAGLLNENKGSLTVSNYGEGSSSFILNAGSVGTNELAANSITDAKILAPISIAKGGTGQTTANAGLNALLPSQTGNSGKGLLSDGTNTSWGIISYSVNDLTDVETVTEAIPVPASNQCLKWDSSASQWKPKEDINTDPPIRPNSPCRAGQIAFDEEYLYCCVANDLWNRAPLSYWNTAEIYPKVITCSFDTYKPEEIGRPADPYINSVSLLLPLNGTNGSTTILDKSPSPLTVSVFGNAAISTTQSKFGGSSLFLDGSGDFITMPTSARFAFGTADFTIEFWIYRIGGNGSLTFLYDSRDGGANNNNVMIYYSGSSDQLQFWAAGNLRISTSSTPPLNAWSHVAVSRNSGTTKMFLNGTQIGSNYADTNNYTASSLPIVFGAQYNQQFTTRGYFDDIRVTKGVGRYPSNFTPPIEQFNSLVI